jgi:hypothetical protein
VVFDCFLLFNWTLGRDVFDVYWKKDWEKVGLGRSSCECGVSKALCNRIAKGAG